MKEITVQEEKEICKNILLYVDAFCKKESITYYLTGGTLLGAVRHKGFIPWDDDIDIAMPRKDYERFIEIFNKQQDKYKVLSYKNSDWYFFPFSKVIDTSTIVKGEVYDYKEMGVFVDVFPLDYLKNDLESAKKAYRRIQKIRNRLYYVKMKPSYINNPLKRMLLVFYKIIYFFVSRKRTNRKIEKICSSISCDDPKYVAALSVMTYGEKEIMDASLYANAIELEFENHYFCSPQGYQKVLENLYGDYMKMPPVDKRIPHYQKVYKKD